MLHDELYPAFITDGDTVTMRTVSVTEGNGTLPFLTINDLWYQIITMDGDGNVAVRVVYV